MVGMSVLGKCIDTMRKIMSTVVDPVQVQDYEWSLEVMDAVSVVLETICEKGTRELINYIHVLTF